MYKCARIGVCMHNFHLCLTYVYHHIVLRTVIALYAVATSAVTFSVWI